MKTIEECLKQDLFIEIKLYYKKEKYYAWGQKEIITKYFYYIIQDIVNISSVLINEENDHYEYSVDILSNDNKYDTYEEALKDAIKECNDYLNQFAKKL